MALSAFDNKKSATVMFQDGESVSIFPVYADAAGISGLVDGKSSFIPWTSIRHVTDIAK